jgi:hypothetical protein
VPIITIAHGERIDAIVEMSERHLDFGELDSAQRSAGMGIVVETRDRPARRRRSQSHRFPGLRHVWRRR